MSINEAVEYYPFGIRAYIVGSLAFGAASVFGICVGLRRAYADMLAYHSATIVGVDLFIFLVVGGVVAAFFLLPALRQWFKLCGYRLQDSALEITYPVVGAKQHVDLSKVTTVRAFNVYPFAARDGRRDSLGRILEMSDGRTIRLCTELRAWPDIAKKCSAILPDE